MKANLLKCLIVAAFGSAAFSTAGCAEKKEKMAEVSLPSAKAVAMPMVAAAVPGPTTAVPAAANASPVVAAQWSDIKDYTYDMRAQFFAGLKGVEARVDDQISELKAKRATMKGTTDTKAWDFEMKAMEAARSYLKSTGVELSKADQETWVQEKDKVGRAWANTQDAYSKVKSSTTN